MIGWERAATVLPHLVPTIVYGTREDKLPYMRPFMKALAGVDLVAVADVAPVDGWSDDGDVARRAARRSHARRPSRPTWPRCASARRSTTCSTSSCTP